MLCYTNVKVAILVFFLKNRRNSECYCCLSNFLSKNNCNTCGCCHSCLFNFFLPWFSKAQSWLMQGYRDRTIDDKSIFPQTQMIDGRNVGEVGVVDCFNCHCYAPPCLLIKQKQVRLVADKFSMFVQPYCCTL